MKTPSLFLCLVAVLCLALPAAVFAADSAKPILVELKNAKGEKIGEAKLLAAKDGVQVHVSAEHLEPGKHGIHIHERGSCVAPEFKSAGGHLNPEHKEHGLENPKGAHAGDMPNLTVDSSGKATADFVDHSVTLGAGADTLERPEGAAIVIHAKADDQHSNPAGEAGDRIACGVIPPGTPLAQH